MDEEVTPGMIAAGTKAFIYWQTADVPALCRDIFLAMIRARAEEEEAATGVDRMRAVTAWNGLADKHGLVRVQQLTPARKAKLSARLRDCGGPDPWQAVLDRIGGIPGMLGNNDRKWRVNFDWLLSASNFTKLMEGNYDGWTGANRKTATSDEVKRGILKGVGLDRQADSAGSSAAGIIDPVDSA